jgi:peptide/nickel transport system substrate-binding protein
MASSPDAKVATPSNYAWIDKAEKTGDFACQNQDEEADARCARVSRDGDADPSQGVSREGRTGGFRRQAGRRGPYKIVKNDQGKEVVFERFDDYWEGSPKGKARDQAAAGPVRPRPDDRGDQPPGQADRLDLEHQPDQANDVNKMPYLQAVRQESMRIGYLSIDAPAARPPATRSPTRRCARRSGTPSTARTWPTS